MTDGEAILAELHGCCRSRLAFGVTLHRGDEHGRGRSHRRQIFSLAAHARIEYAFAMQHLGHLSVSIWVCFGSRVTRRVCPTFQGIVAVTITSSASSAILPAVLIDAGLVVKRTTNLVRAQGWCKPDTRDFSVVAMPSVSIFGRPHIASPAMGSISFNYECSVTLHALADQMIPATRSSS